MTCPAADSLRYLVDLLEAAAKARIAQAWALEQDRQETLRQLSKYGVQDE